MSIYDLTVKDQQGDDVSLGDYADKVLLIVNTATKCGFTPQYDGLQAMYDRFHKRGFEILDFPCNQFLGQAPGTAEEITEFCSVNYGTTFPRFGKVDVNGADADSLYVYLKQHVKTETEDEAAVGLKKVLANLGHRFLGDDIKWNFTKFLVDKNGKVVARFGPTFRPADIEARIKTLLEA